MGLLARLAGIVPNHLALARWGLVSPRTAARRPLVVVQAVVRDGDRLRLNFPSGNMMTFTRSAGTR